MAQLLYEGKGVTNQRTPTTEEGSKKTGKEDVLIKLREEFRE